MDALIEKALNQAANSAMTTARREGSLYIGQTKQGTLELSYGRAQGTYLLVRVGTPTRAPQVLADGKSSTVKPVLKGCYVVVL